MSDFPNAPGLFMPLSGLNQTSAQPSTEFLRLRLTPQIPVLLPIQQLTEVLNVPENQIIPIPDMPAWVMGVYNWRGEILWMVDLGHLCGLASWYQQPMSRSVHSAIVLNVTFPSDAASDATTNAAFAKGPVGFIIRQVEEIESFNPNAIQPLFPDSPMPNVDPGLAPFTTGYWQKSEQEILTVLDAVAILNALSK